MGTDLIKNVKAFLDRDSVKGDLVYKQKRPSI